MTLFFAAVATHGLRTVLITLVPAHRLPAVLRRGLPHLAPAALAGLIVTALVGHAGPLALVVPGPTHLALAAAGLVAWRFRNPALPVLAAVAVAIVVEVLS
ncbi:branched-subunit amino acid transport protein [Actinomycetospora succinea]|uniref:Branched-subunit amino acid transport protein n=1 Tax=Actinomycetospora succinea TaxID=663603 RepID=A0A4R6VHQ2_9PSEU|nr:AzlD domain-containing protein [Actinomycetospora succinea]TDQ62757.1 branched-subunit amino acid transport protein [Actinomycetospora succinea]